MKMTGLGKVWKKTAGAAAAVALAAGVLLGGLFNTSGELLDKNERALPTPPAVVELLEVQNEPDDDGQSEPLQQEKKKGLRERLRLAVLRLPYWLRTVLCLPLWCAGQIVIYSLSLIWTTLLSPVAKAVLPWLCFALVVAAVALAVLKLQNPGLRIRDIFNKRNLIILIVGTLVTAAADVWINLADGGLFMEMTVKSIGSLLTLAAIVLPMIIRNPEGGCGKAEETFSGGI